MALDGLENILKLVQMSSEVEASLRSKLQAVKTHGDDEGTRKAVVEVSGWGVPGDGEMRRRCDG